MSMDIQVTQFLRQGITTAEHFGFRHLDTFKKHPECVACTKKMEHTSSATSRKIDALHGMLAGGIQAFCEAKLQGIDGPVLFYTIEQVPRTGEATLALHIFNVERSIAEAILIQTMRALTTDLGFSDHTIRINSLGDRDSSTRYVRELTNYLRKRIDDMPEAARELMKEHTLYALMHLIEKEHELAFRSPSPLEHLSDPSRKHFRDIIEYLDMSEIPYEIDAKLIGHHECYSDTLFAIDINNAEGAKDPNAPIMVRGGRYSEFVHRATKQQIPAVGAVAILRNKKIPTRLPRTTFSHPNISVIQLGFGPKIKSLLLIDTLRQIGIPVHQNLASDSLSTQLRMAESLGVKYALIMGQKEYVDGTIILRDMAARNQESIPLKTVSQRLRHLAKA
jgi:histidyl-tRNA synthetase